MQKYFIKGICFTFVFLFVVFNINEINNIHTTVIPIPNYTDPQSDADKLQDSQNKWDIEGKVEDRNSTKHCTCYFAGWGDEQKNSSVVGTTREPTLQPTRDVVTKSLYKAHVTIYEGQWTYSDADIEYFGEAKVENSSNDQFNTTLDGKFSGESIRGKFMNGHNTGDYTSVVEQNCSTEACSTIPVSFHSFAGSKEIALGVTAGDLSDGVNATLNAISKEEADQMQNTEYGKGTLSVGADNEPANVDDNQQELKGQLGEIGEECTIIKTAIGDWVSKGIWIMSLIGIVLLIVMSSLDFVKAVIGSDDTKFRDALKHLRSRIIVVVLLLLLPLILGTIINWVNQNAGETQKGVVRIGADNTPFCDTTNAG